jgi:uncharacterized OB-fold protein
MSNGFPRDFRNVDARAWHGNIPMGHKYTMGVAGEEFYKRLRDKGEIVATLHEGNETPVLPPRLYDTDTFAPVDKWVKVGPGGEVDTFTVYGEGKDQRVLALIRVDGADGGLVHWIGGCDADEVEIGMRVKAVVEPKKKRNGGLRDIRHFAPA